jgi:hypothetical protein
VTIVLTSLFLILAVVNTVAFRVKPPDLHAAFSPAASAIEQETAVTISVPGAAKQEYKVYYTVDGADPTDKSPLYSKEGVKVKPGQTLKARVYRGDKPGPVDQAFYGRPEQMPKTPATEAVESQPASAPARAPASAPASSPAPSGAPVRSPEARPASVPASAASPSPAPASAATTASHPAP